VGNKIRIKSQFILSIFIFAIAMLVVFASIVVVNQQLSNLSEQIESAQSIQTGASDLGYLTNNFFLFQEETKLNDWKITMISMSNEISKLNSPNPQQQTLVNNIKTDLGNISKSYTNVVTILWSAPRGESVRVMPEFQTAWNQTSEQYNALNFDSSLLIKFIDEQANQMRATITVLILVVFGLFGAYFLTNYFITYGRTLKSISGLKAATTIVGSGNLEHQIRINQKDEISELALAFNQMTSSLKTVTSSKTELAKEITERKKAELELNQTMEQLVSVNEKLGVVGSLTRHDVRNKLSVVTGYAYLLKKKHGDQADIVEGLGKMEQAVKDSMRIFDFAKMYEQLGVEELFNVELEKPINEAADLFSGLTIKIVNECNGLTILADSFLKQLFYNFLDNSLKHGEKVTQIRLHYTKEVDVVNLFYEDNGVGIPEADKPKLFHEGFSTGKSTGLGLFLIKKMVEVYGWTISEEGEPGKGAKFNITIPKLNKNGKENYKIVP
jgi:signal transduction histidine kinase